MTGRKFPMLVTSVICLSTAGLLFSVGQHHSNPSPQPLASVSQNPFSALAVRSDTSLVASTFQLHDSYDVVEQKMTGFQRIQQDMLNTSTDFATNNPDIPTPDEFAGTEAALHPHPVVHKLVPVRKNQTVQHPSSHPSARPLTSRGQSSLIPGTFGLEVAQYSQRFLGTPYVWGGSSPRGFDCSGFVQYTYQHFGVNLGHSSYGQFQEGAYVSRGNMLPGDLVFFDTDGAGASHVGIYLGGGRFVSAAGSSVRVDSLSEGYWASHYIGGRHIH